MYINSIANSQRPGGSVLTLLFTFMVALPPAARGVRRRDAWPWAVGSGTVTRLFILKVMTSPRRCSRVHAAPCQHACLSRFFSVFIYSTLSFPL